MPNETLARGSSHATVICNFNQIDQDER